MSNRSCRSDTSEKKYFRRLSLWQNCVRNKWIAKWGMRGLFSYPANISALPDGYRAREIYFLFYRYDRTVSIGSWFGLKSERIIFSLPLLLWHGYVSWELKSHGKWEVLSALLSLCQDYDKIKWNEEYRIEGQFSPLISSAVSVLCHTVNRFP